MLNSGRSVAEIPEQSEVLEMVNQVHEQVAE